MWWMNVVVQFILYKQMKKKGENVYAVQLFSMDKVVKREHCVNFYVNGIHNIYYLLNAHPLCVPT
jgi:hypothetical protein